MLRSIVAVVVSYILMAILVVGAFVGMWYGLGPDRLLEPGSWKGNMTINILAPAITLVGGMFGGWVCARLGRGGGPVTGLAGLVLVLGLVSAYFTLQKPEPTGPRPPGMTMEEIMKQGREPTWIAIFNPIAGAAAVLVGGFMLAPRRKSR